MLLFIQDVYNMTKDSMIQHDKSRCSFCCKIVYNLNNVNEKLQ